jgi:hypothetical protein
MLLNMIKKSLEEGALLKDLEKQNSSNDLDKNRVKEVKKII